MIRTVILGTGATVLGIFSGLIHILNLLLKICNWIGMCIITIICTLFSTLSSIVNSTACLLQVLIEDFDFFLSDTWNFILGIVFSISEYVYMSCYVFQALHACFDSVKSVPEYLVKKSTVILDYPIIQNSVHFIELLNRTILLIGTLIWSIPQLLYFLIVEIFLYVLIIVRTTSEAVLSTILITLNIFQRVPYESTLGLFLGITVIHLTVKFKLFMKFLKLSRQLSRRLVSKTIILLSEMTVYLQIGVWVVKETLKKMVSFGKKTYPITRPGFIKDLKTKVICAPSKVELITLLEKEKEEKLCRICMDRQRNVMLLNCRHICMCETCAVEIYSTTGDCPVCRTEIAEFWTVFT